MDRLRQALRSLPWYRVARGQRWRALGQAHSLAGNLEEPNQRREGICRRSRVEDISIDSARSVGDHAVALRRGLRVLASGGQTSAVKGVKSIGWIHKAFKCPTNRAFCRTGAPWRGSVCAVSAVKQHTTKHGSSSRTVKKVSIPQTICSYARMPLNWRQLVQRSAAALRLLVSGQCRTRYEPMVNEFESASNICLLQDYGRVLGSALDAV